MEAEPYQWAFINQLFSTEDAAQLAESFPRDKFKKVKGYDGEKGYEYLSRSLVHMGARMPSHPEGLSPAWQALRTTCYRTNTGRRWTNDWARFDLGTHGSQRGPLWPGAFMGPHLDLKEKLVTHVLYFNEAWDPQHGGCINILRSSNPADVLSEVLPSLATRCCCPLESILALRIARGQALPDIKAQHQRDFSPARFRQHYVAAGEKPALRDYAPVS